LVVDPCSNPAFVYESGNRVKQAPSGEVQIESAVAEGLEEPPDPAATGAPLPLLQGSCTGVGVPSVSPKGSTL
jgi:hypothetical protein